ncbi:MAG: Asp-tRNA(Asn)/Glu-tRNA(Gln) amidotransferase subunit GatA [Spirochaetaceae bacterium]|nr:Asp-tRNA(Asn)/Glu-tRNA(Gln) amidotransferase subunit GatA [Spirochaetaceae bacterium]
MPYKPPEDFVSYCREWEEKIGAFIEFRPDAPGAADVPLPPDAGESGSLSVPSEAKALIAERPFAVKDNIAVKGFSASCGSKLLAAFRSPYSATAVLKLEALGGCVIGKTNLDEFGMGSSTDNSGIQRTNNPWDPSRVPGGSSGGSAAAVSAGMVPFALGSDTGGSVRQPAAFCGVVGLKPTYGAVSRYGLVAYASSLEGIGILADTAARTRAVFASIRGKDPMDDTSRDAPAAAPPLYAGDKNGASDTVTGVIGVLSPEAVAKAVAGAAAINGSSTMNGGAAEAEADGAVSAAARIAAEAAELEGEVRRGFEAAKKGFAVLGYKLVDVEMPGLKYGVPAYYTIAAAEASANLARFDGIRYGKRPDWAENPDDLIDKARDAGFGDEVKLRILLGTFVLRSGFQDRYYLRAQRIRAGIRAGFEALVGGPYGDPAGPAQTMDAILLPVFPTRAFGRGSGSLSPFAQKAADLYTCCANLAGLPAVSFPASVEGGLPVGVQLLGRAFSEGRLLTMVEAYEAAHPFPHPAGYKAFFG